MRRALLAIAIAFSTSMGSACFMTAEDEAPGQRPNRPGTGGAGEGGADGGPGTDDPDGEEPWESEGGGDPTNPTLPIDAGRGFDLAPPYVETLGPSSRSDGHNFAENTPRTNPWRRKCLDCHKEGGSAGNMPFFAAGSVRFNANGAPASRAEVRLKSYINTNAVSAYTDEDGNWFVPLADAQNAGVTFSVRPGVRNATLLRTMTSSPARGNCNDCHGGTVRLF